MKDIYEVYTDGACSNNQGIGGQLGGWGVVFVDGRKFSGADESTTNNRMELKAAVEALKNTPLNSKVKIYSDSAYLINAFVQNWLINWQKNGWVTAQRKTVENQDLWRELLLLEKDRDVEWIKVKGHATDKMNIIADQLAVDAICEYTGGEIKNFKRYEKEDKFLVNLSQDNYLLLLKTIKELAKDDPKFLGIYNELMSK